MSVEEQWLLPYLQGVLAATLQLQQQQPQQPPMQQQQPMQQPFAAAAAAAASQTPQSNNVLIPHLIPFISNNNNNNGTGLGAGSGFQIPVAQNQIFVPGLFNGLANFTQSAAIVGQRQNVVGGVKRNLAKIVVI